MGLNNLDLYFITVNILGFILPILFTRFHPAGKNIQGDFVLEVLTLIGGAAGIFLSILFFGYPAAHGRMAKEKRKSKSGQNSAKDHMMLNVFVSCFVVIQTIIYLMLKGFRPEHFTFAFAEFFRETRALLIYLPTVNLITWTAFGIDKWNAVSNRSRIRVTTLLGLSLAGGAAGGLIAMYTFRHKTRKNYFVVGLPLMIVMQAVVIFYLMNMKL